jgi:hypothetical protein
LSRWHLALPGHQDLPDNDVVHFVGLHIGPLQGFGNGETPEVSGTEIGQRTTHFADWRAGPCDDV